VELVRACSCSMCSTRQYSVDSSWALIFLSALCKLEENVRINVNEIFSVEK